MPLPLILGIGAAIAGVTGLGAGVHGAVNMVKANNSIKSAESEYFLLEKKLEKLNTQASESMDALGKKELDILSSFSRFSEIFEKVHNRPEFADFASSNVSLPTFDPSEVNKVSAGAAALLSGLGSAALGTAGGFAAAGATTAAVMALGTASTGTAISSLSGAAATNAALAALGGGSLAAGGGGMALGATMLGVSTLGVGLLVGGIIFSIAGSSVKNKAERAQAQINENIKEINKINRYLTQLKNHANKYTASLTTVDRIYRKHLDSFACVVEKKGKTNWLEFTEDERLLTQNTVLLVQLLFNMCRINFVIKAKKENSLNKVNVAEINQNITTAAEFIHDNGLENCEYLSRIDSGSRSSAAPSGAAYYSHENLTEEEKNLLALAAVMYYFARCDGSISDEENQIIQDSLISYRDSCNISDAAADELNIICTKEKFSFYNLKLYLKHISLENLQNFCSNMNEIVRASEGITDAEQKARDNFWDYLEERRKENK